MFVVFIFIFSFSFFQVSVSCYDDDVVWGVAPDETVWRWTGNLGDLNPWKNVAGKMKMVSAGQAGVWGIDPTNKVYYREGTYGGDIT